MQMQITFPLTFGPRVAHLDA